MKRNLLEKMGIGLCCLLMLLAFSACTSKSGGTIDEPEITVDYLSGEYAEQLIRDGAESIVGSISMTELDDIYNVTVTEKEVVHSDDYKNGYYIAETNLVKDYTLDGDARMVYPKDDGFTVGDADDFIVNHNNDPDQLYILYYMGDKAELLLPVDPEDVGTY